MPKSNGCEHRVICPRCRSENNFGTFFCYTCGKYFADVEEIAPGCGNGKRGPGRQAHSAPKAKLIMPGGAEMVLTGQPVFVERSDFDNALPGDTVMKISRQHILITCSKGRYYVKDYGPEGKGSTNGTKLNGIDLRNQKRKALKDGDKIELAGQPELTLTFRLLEDHR